MALGIKGFENKIRDRSSPRRAELYIAAGLATQLFYQSPPSLTLLASISYAVY